MFLNVASKNGIIAPLYLSSPERATSFLRQLKLHLDGLHRSVVDEFEDVQICWKQFISDWKCRHWSFLECWRINLFRKNVFEIATSSSYTRTSYTPCYLTFCTVNWVNGLYSKLQEIIPRLAQTVTIVIQFLQKIHPNNQPFRHLQYYSISIVSIKKMILLNEHLPIVYNNNEWSEISQGYWRDARRL